MSSAISSESQPSTTSSDLVLPLSPSSPHTMHRALDIYDIVCRIVEMLSGLPAKDGGDGPTLARLALVCKGFCEPALDVLWRLIYDIMPLLQIVSGTIIEYGYPNPYPRTLIVLLNERISDEDWLRFQYYARRVRSFKSKQRFDRICDSVFSKLAHRADGKPLFPFLQSLWLYESFIPRNFTSFISPSLRFVVLYLGVALGIHPDGYFFPDTEFEQFLSDLGSTAPAIESLHITTDLPHAPLTAIMQFSSLSNLRIGGQCAVSFCNLRWFAELSDLVELYINLPDDIFKLTDGNAINSTGFKKLRHLDVERGTAQSVMYLLKSVSSPHLQSVEWGYGGEASLHEFRDIFAVLASRFSGTMKSIIIKQIELSPEDVRDPPHLMDMVEPLLSLHELRHLELTTEGPAVLTSEDLHAMAVSWPHLHELSLCFCKRAPMELEPSIFSLAAFARHCPKLSSLYLPQMHAKDDPTLTEDTSDIPPHGLQSLQFKPWIERELPCGYSRSVVEDPAKVAHFFDRLFPNVEVWDAIGDLSTVVELQQALQTARREAKSDSDSHRNSRSNQQSDSLESLLHLIVSVCEQEKSQDCVELFCGLEIE